VARLLQILLPLSIALTVFAFALATRREDGSFLLRRPGQLLRSLLSLDVVMPLIAVALVALFELEPPLKIALVALSVSPVSPLIPRTEVKAGGRSSYAVGLLFATAVLAVATIPVSVRAVGKLFGQDVDVAGRAIAPAVLITVLAPVIAGVLVQAFAPHAADRLARPIGRVASVLLVIAFVPMAIHAFRGVLELVGNGTIVAILAHVAAGLVAGHLLGGPERADRTVHALYTVSRHPAVAITVGAAAAPGQQLVVAAVLLYLVLSIVAARLYVRWSTRGRPHPSDVGLATEPIPKHP
jgi:BASS family bile acid:Na+ symporter